MSTSIEAHTHTHLVVKKDRVPQVFLKYMSELPNFQTFQKIFALKTYLITQWKSCVFIFAFRPFFFLEYFSEIWKVYLESRTFPPKWKSWPFWKNLRTGDLSLFNLQKLGGPKLRRSWLMADGAGGMILLWSRSCPCSICHLRSRWRNSH